MTVESRANWLPAEGSGAGSAQTQDVHAADGLLRSGEAQLISGGARVDLAGLQQPRGEAEQAPLPQGRSLSEEEIAAGGFFQERVIEVAATREEPVVEKEVVVREEVVLRKETAERVETIQDTVRRTEVDVDEVRVPEGAAPRTS